ncbi:protein transporter Sec31 [Streptomyces cinnamoneus]|uniref:protein transporter Sec31 n=1 Tax=Streptomyces cinnamoneus TaxID=53446 RepID=UPI0033BFF3F5
MKKYTRVEKRIRKVPHTRGGVQRTVDQEYEVEVFVPPRDWDNIVRNGVGAITGVMGAVTLAWSTASIGGLLSIAVDPDPVAYLAAGVFDAGWMTCAAMEWLNRYDSRKAELPRIAGHVLLALAMAAVYADGHLAGSWVIGAIGAAVSLIAKGMWALTMSQYSRPLDPLTQQWLDQADDEAVARLAELHRTKQIRAAEYRCAAEAAALAIQPAPFALPTAPNPPAARDSKDQDVAPPNGETPRTPLTDKGAPGPEQLELPHEDVVRRLAPPGQSVRTTTQTAVASGLQEQPDVLRYVQSIHGAGVNAATVDRYRRGFIREAG